jgi:phosphatidylinositol glycan class A protein
MLLAEPSPAGLLEALEAALARLHAFDPQAQAAQVRSMYSWANVAARTVKVYDAAAGSARWGAGWLVGWVAATAASCCQLQLAAGRAGSASWPLRDQLRGLQRSWLMLPLLRRRDDSLPARLSRYSRCGLWAGWLFCLLALLDCLLYRLVRWLRPDSDIELAVDWPAGEEGGADEGRH